MQKRQSRHKKQKGNKKMSVFLENVKSFFLNLPVPLWIRVLVCGMIPLVEARYSILFFMDSGLEYYKLFLLSVLGNMIPVPFIIYLFRPILGFLRRTKTLSSLARRLEERTEKKTAQLQKYSSLGLFLFVAVPLPGTGALTGAMVAAFLGMREIYALPAIFLGTITATFLTTGAMTAITQLFSFIF